MKFKLLFLAALLGCSYAHAQKSKGTFTAKFEDGVMLSYDLYQNRGDECFNKHATYLSLGNNIGLTNELSYSVLIPDKLTYKGGIYASIIGGFGGVTASGIYYLKSSEKEIKNGFTVKSYQVGDQITRYKVSIPSIKNKYFGIHGELAYNTFSPNGGLLEYTASNQGHYVISDVSYGVVALGIGYNSLKGGQIKVDDTDGGYTGGTRLFTAIADVAFYPGFGVKADPVSGDSIAMSQDFDKKEYSDGAVGFRAYVQAQTSFMYHKKKTPKGAVGIVWRLGVSREPKSNALLTIGSGAITPMLGLGLMYTFY